MRGKEAIYGGNRVVQYDRLESGVFEFSSEPYIYYLVVLDSGRSHRVEGLQSYTVFSLRDGSGGPVLVEGREEVLEPGDSFQTERLSLTLVAKGGSTRLLVAGTKERHAESSSVTRTAAGNHYTVVKPWGHELWINGEHPGYCLKEVFIRAPNRTSLQYHNEKVETNVLFGGKARLIYRTGSGDDLAGVELIPLSVVHISPPAVHRLESLEDVLLYETSTPHLDDVVRLQDDAARSDGRIPSEHGKKP